MKRILNEESRAAIELMIANDLITKDVAEKYFPELKESEDERIINNIKKVIGWYRGMFTEKSLMPEEYQEINAWLEKQGEHANFRNKIQIGDKVTRNEDGVLVNLSQLNRVAKKQGEQKDILEDAILDSNEDGLIAETLGVKQGEQKSADKVEPKFKIGDIVKYKDNPHLTYILKRFTDDGDYEFHAIGKDGNEGCTRFTVVKYQDDWELVEQKPKKCMYSNDNYTYEERKVLCDGCKEECELRQKPEWSEEDEVKINRIVACLENLNVADNDILLKDVEWLKSLKDRYTWKPTELQLECLSDAIDSYNKRGYSASVLSELLEQLKKLRDE